MIRFLIKRLLGLIPTLLLVATLVFFLTRLAPGGPFDAERAVPPEVLAALNAKYDQLQSSHAAALAEARGRPDAAPTNELSLLRDLEKKGKQLDHMRDLLQHSGMLLWLVCCCCGFVSLQCSGMLLLLFF